MGSKCPAPEGFLLGRIRWDYFVTLTHTSKGMGRWRNPSARVQFQRFRHWHNKCLKMLKMHSNSFRYIKRWEVGSGGREHFHCLVNFHKADRVTKTAMYQLKDAWEHQKLCKCKPEDLKATDKYPTCRFGGADVRSCNSSGVQEYITKLQNEYELNRFGADRFRHVEISKSALKCFRRQLKGIAVHTGY